MGFDERTRIVTGESGAARLAAARVCVFGLGGVGAAAAMDLVRAGIGTVVAVDFDVVSGSNLNRLYFGYADTLGMPKTEAFSLDARRVNPAVAVEGIGSIVRGAHAAERIPAGCDFYLDCIDSLNPKVNLMAALERAGLAFLSSMGTAGRLAPERLRPGSLWETRDCPLSSLVRKRLRRLGYGPPGSGAERESRFDCVWSDEPAVEPVMPADGRTPGETVGGVRIRAVQGSAPFVPQAAGHLMASIAVRSILGLWKGGGKPAIRS